MTDVEVGEVDEAIATERSDAQGNGDAHPLAACRFAFMAPYERLHAWRECHELALAVYHATKQFPVEERYGLTSQTRRAAFSAAVNIVEGSARRSRKEFRRFLDISLSSLTEVGYALQFAKAAGLLPENDWTGLNDRQNRAHFLTWRLYRSLGPP